jgi:hypothetical protein
MGFGSGSVRGCERRFGLGLVWRAKAGSGRGCGGCLEGVG